MKSFVRIVFYSLIIAALAVINFNQLNLTKAEDTAPITAPITSPEVTPKPTPSLVPTLTPQPTNPPSDNHDNGGSSNGSSSSGGNSGPSVCGEQKPGTPVLLNLIKTGPNQVMLSWSKPIGPVSGYVLAYGLTPTKMLYGNPNVGSTNFYVVNHLQAGVAYYFRVWAANGCMPGEFSNPLGISAYGKVLGQTYATPTVANDFKPGVLSAKAKYVAPKAQVYQPTIPVIKNETPVQSPVTNLFDALVFKAIRFFYR